MGLQGSCLEPVSRGWDRARELLVDARHARLGFVNAGTGSEYAGVAREYNGSWHPVERFYGLRAKRRARRDWQPVNMEQEELDREFILGD